jgi:hypothetical protein
VSLISYLHAGNYLQTEVTGLTSAHLKEVTGHTLNTAGEKGNFSGGIDMLCIASEQQTTASPMTERAGLLKLTFQEESAKPMTERLDESPLPTNIYVHAEASTENTGLIESFEPSAPISSFRVDHKKSKM